jgi:hypothetical protein
MADPGRATQHRGVGIDHHSVLDRRMTLRASHEMPLRIGLKRERSEGHALIELHAATDLARLSDHHTGAVVDEEMVADRRPRMDVDARPRVSLFGHHARDQWHLQTVKQVCQPMNGDGLESRIAEDHLVECPDGGIAVVGGLHIGGEHPTQVGNAF